MIQSRAINCTAHDQYGQDDKDKFVGSCRIGQTDIALRLLEQGWATLDQSVKERRYLEASEYGREKGLGLRTSAPPKLR
jgi:endonuclease YncB( thermonuclease family)